MKELKTSFFTILFIFVGLFLYTRFAGALPFSVNSIQTTKTTLFTVDGTGEATAIPDTSLIELGVTKTAPTVLQAQNQTNTAIAKIMQDLKGLGIEEKNIKTTNYSVYPATDFSINQKTPTGYTVSQNLEVKVKPIDKANQAIDLATADGANIVGGATFIFDDETQKQLAQKARMEAIQKAKEKAESLASATGIHLGRIVDVQESGNPSPVRFSALELPKAADHQPTNITPGENKVTTTITLSYETY